MTISADEARAGISNARRWTMLAVGTGGQMAASISMHGPAFLIPALVTQHDLSLGEAGLIVTTPMIGVMASLLLWGTLADAIGERVVLISGLIAASLFGFAASLSDNLTLFALALGLGGAAAASSNVASARVVAGWFAPQRRGLAMGIRQTAQPMGVGISAFAMALTADSRGIQAAMLIPAITTAIAACAVVISVIDPPRPTRSTVTSQNPYRNESYLARIHGASILLVIPQFMVWTFALVWLIEEHNWSPGAAGAAVALSQIAGVGARVSAGFVSDLVGSRLGPIRWIAVAASAAMLILSAASDAPSWLALTIVTITSAVTVSDNGLAFTAIAERAGPFWSGRALAVQNTGQFLISSFVPPVGGVMIGTLGFGWTFALCAFFPLVAAWMVPARDELDVS